jgi:restriction system protein
MNKDSILWGIHMPIESEAIALGKHPELGISWFELGDLSSFKTRDEIQDHYQKTYPSATEKSALTNASQLFHFLIDMKVGDLVMFPSKSRHQIYLGEIAGEYHFDASDSALPNRRTVKWLKICPRTDFSQGALYEAGSFHTIFQVKQYKIEYLAKLDPSLAQGDEGVNGPDGPDETIGVTLASIENQTRDFILKELARQYKGYPLQDVVKDLLEAMGYNAQNGAKGADGGIDLIAYKDEFPPRIVVQVKSFDKSSAGLSDVKNLYATLSTGDVGIFVTLEDYTQQAKDYLKSKPNIRALNGYDFVGLIQKYYDEMPLDFKTKIPLKRVYFPATPED